MFKKVLFAEIQRALKIVTLNDKSIKFVYKDKKLNSWALFILFFPFLFNLFLFSFNYPSAYGLIFFKSVVWPVVIWLLSILISIWATAMFLTRFYRVKLDFLGFFRVIAYASILFWSLIVPSFFSSFNLFVKILLVYIFYVFYRVFITLFHLDKKSSFSALLFLLFVWFFSQKFLAYILIGSYYSIF